MQQGHYPRLHGDGDVIQDEIAAAVVENLKIDAIERHIFLCCDQTKPKCSDRDASLESWNFLKRRPPPSAPGPAS